MKNKNDTLGVGKKTTPTMMSIACVRCSRKDEETL